MCIWLDYFTYHQELCMFSVKKHYNRVRKIPFFQQMSQNVPFFSSQLNSYNKLQWIHRVGVSFQLRFQAVTQESL